MSHGNMPDYCFPNRGALAIGRDRLPGRSHCFILLTDTPSLTMINPGVLLVVSAPTLIVCAGWGKAVNIPSACVTCGKALRPDAQYCGGCGGPALTAVTCHRCGATIFAGDAFCSSCGGARTNLPPAAPILQGSAVTHTYERPELPSTAMSASRPLARPPLHVGLEAPARTVARGDEVIDLPPIRRYRRRTNSQPELSHREYRKSLYTVEAVSAPYSSDVLNLGRWTGWFLVACAVLAVATAVFGFLHGMALNAVIISAPGASVDDVRTIFSVFQMVRLVFWVVVVVTVILFIRWTATAMHNVVGLGAIELKYRDWPIAGWLVPIWFLFRPYQVVKETWKASDPDTPTSTAGSRAYSSTHWAIGWWWGFWLLAQLLSSMAAQFGEEAATNSQIRDAQYFLVFVMCINATTSLLAAKVVWAMRARQTEKLG